MLLNINHKRKYRVYKCTYYARALFFFYLFVYRWPFELLSLEKRTFVHRNFPLGCIEHFGFYTVENVKYRASFDRDACALADLTIQHLVQTVRPETVSGLFKRVVQLYLLPNYI